MITWDAPRRQTNLAKHGLDFPDLMAIGRLADRTVAVVFAALGTEGCR